MQFLEPCQTPDSFLKLVLDIMSSVIVLGAVLCVLFTFSLAMGFGYQDHSILSWLWELINFPRVGLNLTDTLWMLLVRHHFCHWSQTRDEDYIAWDKLGFHLLSGPVELSSSKTWQGLTPFLTNVLLLPVSATTSTGEICTTDFTFVKLNQHFPHSCCSLHVISAVY